MDNEVQEIKKKSPISLRYFKKEMRNLVSESVNPTKRLMTSE